VKKFLAVLAILFFSLFGYLATAQPLQAQINPDSLAQNIDDFLGAGASGFLVWQFGGDVSRPIAVDQFSFFRGRDEAVCIVMQEKKAQYPGKFIGVNINNIGAVEFANGVAVGEMRWLRDNCGVTVIRMFAKIEGASGVSNALAAAQEVTADGLGEMKIIVAVGDYANGGGGIPQGAGKSWYETGYKGEYLSLVNEIVSTLNGNPGLKSALYGIELANEPHCGGDASAIEAYTNWGQDIGSILQGVTGNVGYGQMASQDPTRCDSPRPGDFKISNAAGAITMTSAHFYTDDEKASAFAALQASGELGKPFYIGEAPPGSLDEDTTTPPAVPFDPTNYYLVPLCTAEPKPCLVGDFESRKAAYLKAMLGQGFSARITAEKQVIKVETNDKYDEWLLTNPSEVIERATSGEQEFKGEGEAMLMRSKSISSATASLEQINNFIPTIGAEAIDAAYLENSLSLKQKCQQKLRGLTKIQNQCLRLVDDSKCAEYYPITSCPYNTNTLLGQIESEGLECDSFTKWEPQLQSCLMKVPFDKLNTYQWGFLIAATEIEESEKSIFDLKCKFFCKLFGGEDGTEPLIDKGHEVKISPLKISDYGTERHPEILQRRDTTILVRENYNSHKTNERITAIRNADRESYEARVLDAANGREKPNIDCKGEVCEDPLAAALIDIINGFDIECGGLLGEDATQLGVPTTITDDEAQDQKEGPDPLTVLEFFPQLTKLLFDNFWTFSTESDRGETAETCTYFVGPLNFEIERYSDTLGNVNKAHSDSLFGKSSDYFPIQGAGPQQITGTKTGFFFESPSDCSTFTDPETGEEVVDCSKEATAELESDSTGASLFHADLGPNSLRQQIWLQPYNGPRHQLLRSCFETDKPTENFLTGAGDCQGGEFEFESVSEESE